MQETAEPVIPDADSLGSLADFWWADYSGVLAQHGLGDRVARPLDGVDKTAQTESPIGTCSVRDIAEYTEMCSGSSIQWQFNTVAVKKEG